MATSPSFRTTAINFSTEAGMSVRRLGTGAELVWIHGLGESSTSFEPVVAKLPQFAHTLIDLPGYGRSAWPAEPFGLEALADHLAAWLKPRPLATLIGHSMGGVLAVLLAERGAARAIIDIDGNVTRADCTFSAQATAITETEFVDGGFAAIRDTVYRDGVAEAPLRTYHAAMCFAQPRTFYKQATALVALSETGSMAPRFVVFLVLVFFFVCVLC